VVGDASLGARDLGCLFLRGKQAFLVEVVEVLATLSYRLVLAQGGPFACLLFQRVDLGLEPSTLHQRGLRSCVLGFEHCLPLKPLQGLSLPDTLLVVELGLSVVTPAAPPACVPVFLAQLAAEMRGFVKLFLGRLGGPLGMLTAPLLQGGEELGRRLVLGGTKR
jgi:hypothetical protein